MSLYIKNQFLNLRVCVCVCVCVCVFVCGFGTMSMMYKILQWLGTASGTALQKRCSRICGYNPRLIYLQKVSKNPLLKLNFLKYIFQGFWLQHYNNTLKYAAKVTLSP